LVEGGKSISVAGGADLFLTVEVGPDIQLPVRVEGDLVLEGLKGENRAVYIVGREWNGGKVVTSPLFLEYS
jgi:hypothetical protein